MPDVYGQPSEMAFPLRFVVAVFADQATAANAQRMLTREEVMAEDIFVFHARRVDGPTTLMLYELRDAHGAPIAPARQSHQDGSERDIGTPAPPQRTMVLVYVSTPEVERRVIALLYAAHGYLLDAVVDHTSANR